MKTEASGEKSRQTRSVVDVSFALGSEIGDAFVLLVAVLDDVGDAG